MWKLLGFSFALAMLAVAWPTSDAKAAAYGCKNDAKACYVSDYCTTSDAICGGIGYINEGGYVVSPVKLWAKDSQPSGATINPKCAGVNFVFNADVDLGQGLQFIVPTNCALKLKINIKAGRTKSRDLFLTPGCAIKLSTDGTTLQNDWHMKVSWSDQAKKQGKSGTVQDPEGNKCGRLSKM
jgi:hypothetical protein